MTRVLTRLRRKVRSTARTAKVPSNGWEWARARGRAVAVVLALAAVAGVTYAVWPEAPRRHLVAHFPRTVGLYAGSDVRILGVPVGRVDQVRPEGTAVRVEMSYDAKQKVPANARAVVISPSLVSDRYVQLTPVYRGGPVLADGAEIALPRTAVPVELDRIYQSLDDLVVALGPNGANRKGSLSRLLTVGADNLRGQGGKLHTTVGDLADATQTLSGGREDLFATVRQLQEFTGALAASDTQVRAFNTDLAGVADQLAGERGDLRAALAQLAAALTDVAAFVRDNRAEVRANVHGLTELSKTLVRQQDALREVLDTAPVALSNLDHTYNPGTGTLDTRNNFAQTDDPGAYLCALLRQSGQPKSVCDDLTKVLDDLPLPQVPGGPAVNGTAGPGGAAGGGGTAAGRPAATSDRTLGGILR
ncbi:MCE family protein [Actinopolymorpha rutila]|uniref:Phospholipid/cholesterol/gamma-HCH transport system substrate-binding protein n=1 Tax=Actinopolymorpha rutila TaxID=446787 RepID=A0A852ZJU7_9ACTN|nr:MCE family protein [Actinopolymorpha rutila]NYH91872.1 phospholipid/cholesterol/gamma-HCH transport system substrate-binding protein [Actinopolymorpha rutila]